MRNLLMLLVLAAGAWFGYEKHKAMNPSLATRGEISSADDLASTHFAETRAAETPFSCDGRTRCSQMHSCAEATYFIQHCPGTQMDGDNDGILCESQWCDQGS